MNADEMVKVSFDMADIPKLKLGIMHDRPYFDRVSVGLAFRMFSVQKIYGEYDCVLRELDYLEGIVSHSNTKEAAQFEHPPLYPFWHKHFFTTHHMLRNIGTHWGIADSGQGNRRFDKLMRGITDNDGHKVGVWPGRLAYKFVMEGWVKRARKRKLTGDWIVYAKHGDQNYYLDIATHDEDQQQLLEKLKSSSEAEFPFLFKA